jgi:hypothetical protein
MNTGNEPQPVAGLRHPPHHRFDGVHGMAEQSGLRLQSNRCFD